MWITIKEQLINLNHISSIKWDERGDNLYLYLYRAKPHHLDNKFTFEWYIGEYNSRLSTEVTEEINHVSYIISNATNTLKPIFNHDLADNSDDLIVKAVQDLRKYPSNEKVGRKGRVKRADDKRLKQNREHSVNPNAEFIGE
tara:strand:+ start:186 stop:611 length:426 start_codon:yes stop_codon:yes gene_type:complete